MIEKLKDTSTTISTHEIVNGYAEKDITWANKDPWSDKMHISFVIPGQNFWNEKDPWDRKKNIEDNIDKVDTPQEMFVSVDNDKVGNPDNRSECQRYMDKEVFLPTNNGHWDGEVGNSTWIPDDEHVPDPDNGKGGNPERKTWGEIKKKYEIDGIEFKDGEPDFSSVSEAEVKIKEFTTNRQKNFAQADTLLAEKWSEEKKDGKEWTARDIANYRKEYGYTWHECKDQKTIQLVPKEIHNNIPHAGGISEAKKQENNNI